MTWQCKMVNPEDPKEIDSMWHEESDSPEPKILYVCMPGGVILPLNANSFLDRWTVTGDPPNITVTPSIRYPGGWHGYITNGVISDDVGN